MNDYKIINEIDNNNFLFGGLIYHHKNILDVEERRKQFEKEVEAQTENIDYSDIDYDGINENINPYVLKSMISNIKKSNSLNESVMNKTINYFSAETIKYPMDDIYETEKHENVFIDKGIQILNSDVIIFIPFTGIVGDIFQPTNEKQKLCIIYNFDKNLNINIGRIFDYKLIEDFLNYKQVMGDFNG